MEYVEGRSLEEVERPKIKPLVIVFNQVASALVHMHRRGIYHGDLKPSNIMVTEVRPCQTDRFRHGVDQGAGEGARPGDPQLHGARAGERPDRRRSDRHLQLRRDHVSMFTGRYANAEAPSTALGDLRNLVPPIQVNERIPGTLNETIMACLQWLPERRPAGMFEVQHQLKAVARYMKLKLVDLGSEEEDE
jgi:serine/threonine-protein kinase